MGDLRAEILSGPVERLAREVAAQHKLTGLVDEDLHDEAKRRGILDEEGRFTDLGIAAVKRKK